MKNFTKLGMVTVAMALSFLPVGAQSTYTDDFKVNKDYSVDLDGTIWTGLKTGLGLVDDAAITEATLDALNTTDNTDALTFTTENSNWGTENDNGIFLYKELSAAGVDFDAKVQIVGGDFGSFGNTAVDYLMVGLSARRTDTVGFVAVQAFDRPNWGAVYGLRDIPMSPQENWAWGVDADTAVKQGVEDANADTLKIATYPWQRLQKVGDVYSVSVSTNGTDWIKLLSVSRPDMAGQKLQVGLYNATYTATAGSVIFDDFSLVDYGGTAIKNITSSNELQAAYSSVLNAIVVKNSNQSIMNVKIVSVDGRVISTINSNNSSIEIPVSGKGLYFVVAETKDGNIYSKKTLVY